MLLDLDAIFDPDRHSARHPARLFRRAVRNPACGQEHATISPSDLPTDWFVEWDERAAIMEYDGGVTRERAEFFALRDVLRHMNDERASDENPGGES